MGFLRQFDVWMLVQALVLVNFLEMVGREFCGTKNGEEVVLSLLSEGY